MKKLIVFIPICMLHSIIHSQEIKNVYQQKNLKGYVKTLKEFEVAPIPPMQIQGEQTIDTLLSGYWEFDKDQDVIKSHIYINGTLIYVNEFRYGNTGQMLEKLVYSQGRPYGKITYTYKNQLLSSQIAYDTNGTETQKIRYQYNSNGKVTEMKYNNYNNSEDPEGSVRYTYNKEKNEVKMKSYSGSVLTYTEISQYDKEGNRIEWIKNYGEDELLTRFSYKYTVTPQGKEIELAFYPEAGKLANTTIFKYNKNGDPTETITYQPDGFIESTRTYEYQYDSHGNWISQTMRGGEEPYAILREITYWE